MIDTLYAIPTYRCNLSCSHCNIRYNFSSENIDKFADVLSTLLANKTILFGGEPLLLEVEHLSRIMATSKIDAISTNLLLLSKMHLELFSEHSIDIATSWNPIRFTKSLYESWIDNIKKLLDAKLHVTVLITLTEDLQTSNVFDVLDDLDSISNSFFDGVKFEPYVQSSEELISKSDIWLTQIIEKWKYSFKNILFEEYKTGNLNFCNKTYTLMPNGKLFHSCPLFETDYFIDNCLKCKYNKVCRPCKKLSVCTFFKNFYLKVQQLCQ